MVIPVEHEIHRRRRGRNLGVALVLLGFVAVIFGLTVVKILNLGNPEAFEAYDHVAPRVGSDQAAPEGGAD